MKELTIFDILNEMQEASVGLFWNQAGGKQVGKGKAKNAIIEVLVDNDTFQNFAFQKTYGHSKTDKDKLGFVFLSFNQKEYNEVLANMQAKRIKPKSKNKTI